MSVMDIDVSFSKDVFTKDEFNVDRFLQESCQKSGLHKLHKELGTYIKYLQAMIVDLVNNESNAIVNLSSDLKVLQNKFGNLSSPLGQLKEELMQIYKMIDTNLSSIKFLLNKKESIGNQKSSKMNELRMLTTSQKVGSILQAHVDEENVEMEIIERSVNQYIMQHMYSQLCDSHNYNFKNTDTLYRILNYVFLKSIVDSDTEKCTRCLQMYMLMNAQSIAENLYRSEITRPAMRSIINESVLKANGGDVTHIYSKIIDFVHTRTSYILGVINRNYELTGFNFVLRAVWLEVCEQLRLQLSSVYAPGNPAVFHSRFQEMCDFLGQLEQCFVGDGERKEFRIHESYRQHQMLWNLHVYFEIRYLEIVHSVEECLRDSTVRDNSITDAPHNEFRIVACEKAWLAMERCFADDVFLPQLLDKFWKLTLQIISRLNVWISTTITPSISLELAAQSNTDPNSELHKNELKLKFLTYLHIDVMTFIGRLNGDLNFVKSYIPEILKDKIKLSLEEFTQRSFPTRLKLLEDLMIDHIYKECSVHVKNVSQIPRLYRKTNRSAPNSPSAYVNSMCRPIQHFSTSYKLDASVMNRLVGEVHTRVTNEYGALVGGVLTSVAKTEESLRRLKKTRASGDTAASSESADDQKIRAQLQIDVRSYSQIAGQFVDVTELNRLAKEASPSKEAP